MNYEQRIQAMVDSLKQKYGIPSVLALAIDVAGVAVGGWLLIQSSLLFTLAGFALGMASLGGLLNKVLHGGS